MKIKPNITFQSLNTIPGFKIQQAVLCNCTDALNSPAGNQKDSQTIQTFSFYFYIKKKKYKSQKEQINRQAATFPEEKPNDCTLHIYALKKCHKQA